MTPLNDGLRLRAADEMSARLSDMLTVPPPAESGEDYGPRSPRWRHQSLSRGAAGVAILHGVRARHGHASAYRAHPWLTLATHEDLSAAPGAGLWFGAPAVAFAITVAAPQHYHQAMTSLDTAIAELVRTNLDAARTRMAAALRPVRSEFDLVHGLTSLGAYLLHRDPHSDLMGRILNYLVRLTEPIAADDGIGFRAPGWWTSDAPSGQPAGRFAAGHANFGMAHGIAGPLALLALAMRRGITVDGQAAATEVICDWLDAWRQATPAGPWWPEYIDAGELRARNPTGSGPGRPSWCYGTPGLARAQQLAGLALGDQARQVAAEDALTHCLADPTQLARIVDPALCHGWAGLLATTWCAATDARSPNLRAHLPHLLNGLLDHVGTAPAEPLTGLIEGNAGAALTLDSIVRGNPNEPWLTCLLLN